MTVIFSDKTSGAPGRAYCTRAGNEKERVHTALFISTCKNNAVKLTDVSINSGVCFSVGVLRLVTLAQVFSTVVTLG